MNVKCECQNCHGHLQFDSEGIGLTIDCPHCGAKTQLYLPQKKLDKRSHTKVFLTATLSISVLILTLISVVVFRVQKGKTDLNKSQDSATANLAENNFQRYLQNRNFPFNERSFEIKETGPYESKIIRTYSISYINPDCILVKRSVVLLDLGHFDDDRLIHNWENMSAEQLDTALDGPRIEFRHSIEKDSTQFRILRSEDEASNWIATYKKWRQISLAENLAIGVEKNISKCCTGQDMHSANFEDVKFITPNILKIGRGKWSEVEVDRLEKLLSMIPDLDGDIKTIMAKKAKVENDLANQKQFRQNEENKARSLLK